MAGMKISTVLILRILNNGTITKDKAGSKYSTIRIMEKLRRANVMKRTEYCSFPEQLNHVKAIGFKDVILINSNFPEGEETERFYAPQFSNRQEDK